MATRTLSLARWNRELRRLGEEFRPTVLRGMRAGGARALPALQTATRNARPASAGGATGAVDTGNYLRRWKSAPLSNGVVIFNDAPYAGVIEGGRRAGSMPPLKAIARWAQLRLGLSKKEAVQAAFPIAKAIAKRGLRARNVLSGQDTRIGTLIADEVDFELKRQLRSRGFAS
jgi:hypothetical protein